MTSGTLGLRKVSPALRNDHARFSERSPVQGSVASLCTEGVWLLGRVRLACRPSTEAPAPRQESDNSAASCNPERCPLIEAEEKARPISGEERRHRIQGHVKHRPRLGHHPGPASFVGHPVMMA